MAGLSSNARFDQFGFDMHTRDLERLWLLYDGISGQATTVQAGQTVDLGADLTAIQGLQGSGFLYRVQPGAWELRSEDSVRGLAGPVGPAGATGPTGPAGPGFTDGTAIGQTKAWDGSSWANVTAGTALSVFGRSANTNGQPTAIVAATSGHVLRYNGTALVWGSVNLAGANDITGALGVANGGIGATTATGAGRMPVSSAATTAAWSATPTLGVAGSALGSLTLESANVTAGSRLRVVVAGNEISLYYGGTTTTDLVMRIQESDFASIATSIKGTTNCIQARVIAECDSTGAAKSRIYLCSAQY